MYHYRQVLVRMRQGDTDREIARSKLMGRRKAAALRQLAQAQGWLEGAAPLPDDATLAQMLAPSTSLPASCISSLEKLRAVIEPWFDAGIQGTTIHAALARNHGYTGSYSAVRRFLQQLAASRPAPDATCRLSFEPGEAVQVDFGAGPVIVDAMTGEVTKTWFFVMTLCWSRHQYVELVRDQTVATWLACHRHAFEWFGGVPAKVIIDNAKCAITRACLHDPEVQRAYAECAEGYGFRISACPPHDPQKKGIVEAGVKYVKRSFLPLRDFRGLADGNRQVQEWVLEIAGNRCHGTTRESPLARFAIERDLLQRLPAVPPELATWTKAVVHRDSHVQFEHNLYSVPFALIGQSLWLKASASTVCCYREHALVATHPRLSGRGQRATVTDHLPPEAVAFAMADPQYCLRKAQAIGPSCHALIEHLFADRILDNLRAAQGVIRLEAKVGAQRLEAACARALSFAAPRYRTVKTILDKGLDLQPDTAAFDALSDTYTRGGRFCRDVPTLLSH
jgi:transposase